jgi:hypothetical protein
MKQTATWLTFVLVATVVACSSKSDEGEDGSSAVVSNADELKACRMFDVRQQKFIELTEFVADDAHPERANDPVLQKLMAGVLSGKSCPKTYAEMQEVEELQSCNLQTRIVSERAQLTGQPDEGRALASRTCGSTPALFFLLDPVDTRTDAIPKDVEVMGNNTVDGVFSYYAREPSDGDESVWKFYGTSADFVTNDYDCSVAKFHGACQSKLAQDNGVSGAKSGIRCASCHPGGGMVQKELNSPWTNWMKDPGGFTGKHSKELGSFQDGDSFESTTASLNAKWAKKRAQILAKKSVNELLRPVFCTMDINLQAGSTNARADLMIDLVFAKPVEFFGNPDAFGSHGATQIGALAPANYAAALKANGQKIDADFGGKTFSDTPDTFMYPERSGLDHQYVAALKSESLVSEDLIRDILFVDFTRPIFSPTRCGLVELADGISNASQAKDELVKKLEAKSRSAGEDEFLASLKSASPAPRHQVEADAYLGKCRARATSDNAGFTNDVVAYASHLRRVSRLMKVKLKNEEFELGIIDFDETLPHDKLDDQAISDPRFDPATCVLGK